MKLPAIARRVMVKPTSRAATARSSAIRCQERGVTIREVPARRLLTLPVPAA